MRKLFQLSLALCIFFFEAPEASAQSVRDFKALEAAHILSGSIPKERLGSAVSSAGDVNNDGYGDFLAGGPYADSPGRTLVVDGRTGQIIHQVTAEQPGTYFGSALSAAGDVNRDGYDDFLVGAFGDSSTNPYSGRVFLYSGKDAQLIWSSSCGNTSYAGCGWSIRGQCKFNNDEIPDVLVGAPYQDGDRGAVYALDGRSGQIIGSFLGSSSFELFGYAVACEADADQDGLDDWLVGAPGFNRESGKALLISSQSQDLIWEAVGDPASKFGGAVGFLGSGLNFRWVVGAPQASSAYVFDSAGNLSMNLRPPEGGRYFGISVSNMGDIDADGESDLLIGDSGFNYNYGRAFVFSGRNFDLLYTYTGEFISNGSDRFGVSLFAAGDANRDGVSDIVIGAPLNSSAVHEGGRVYLFYLPNLNPNPPPPEDPTGGGSGGGENPPPPPGDEEDPGEPEAPVCENPPPPEITDIRDLIDFIDGSYSDFSWNSLIELLKYWKSKMTDERSGWGFGEIIKIFQGKTDKKQADEKKK